MRYNSVLGQLSLLDSTELMQSIWKVSPVMPRIFLWIPMFEKFAATDRIVAVESICLTRA
jgi:hypothetical protein